MGLVLVSAVAAQGPSCKTISESMKISSTPYKSYDRAIKELFRKNKPHFAKSDWPEEGRLDYYGFEVTKISDDGSIIDLKWTFKTTEKYCCIELGCHASYGDKKWWKILRDRLLVDGINPPSMTITVIAIIEKNVRLSLPTSHEEEKGYQYTACWKEPDANWGCGRLSEAKDGYP